MLSKLWDQLWFKEFDPLPIALFRISFGILLLLMFLCLHSNWNLYYGLNGITQLSDSEIAHPLQRWSIFSQMKFVPIQAWWWLAMLATSSFTMGFQTRLATILLFVIQTSMMMRTPVLTNGEDLLFRMLLFLSCFSPLGRRLSIDHHFKKRKGPSPVWPLRLLQINIALMYLFTISDKLANAEWRNGEALYWVLANPMLTRWPWPAWLCTGALGKLMTYGTVAAEVGFPLLVWFKKTRLLLIAVMLSMHMGIAIFMSNVTFFTLGMVCSLWLFVPSETIRKWNEKLKNNMRTVSDSSQFNLFLM